MISQAGLKFLKQEEGFLPYIYDDKAKGRPKPMYKRGQIVNGTLTIGYGHAIKKGDPWKVGEVYTEEELSKQFVSDLQWVYAVIATHVKVPLNQNQEDMLASIIFNCGPGKGKRGQTDYVPGIANSRLMEALNRGDYKQAAVHFLDWKFSGGQPILLNRRKRERAIFETPVLPPKPKVVPVGDISPSKPTIKSVAKPVDKPKPKK